MFIDALNYYSSICYPLRLKLYVALKKLSRIICRYEILMIFFLLYP